MRISLITVVAAAFVVGCQGVDSLLSFPSSAGLSWADRQAVARCLPTNLKLSTVIWADRYGDNPVTLEERLAEVGAHVGGGGKLIASNGKEIYFFHIIKRGCWSDEQEAAERAAYQELEAIFCVIDVDDTPGDFTAC